MNEKEKRVIVYSSKYECMKGNRPLEKVFFDTKNGEFLNYKQTEELLNSDADGVELKFSDIPYTIELRFTSLTHYDSVRSCVISKSEATKLINNGGACLKVLQGEDERRSIKNETRLLAAKGLATTSEGATTTSEPTAKKLATTSVEATTKSKTPSEDKGPQSSFCTMITICSAVSAAIFWAYGRTRLAAFAATIALYSNFMSADSKPQPKSTNSKLQPISTNSKPQPQYPKDNKPREIVYSMNGNGENLFFDTKDKKFIQKDVAGILLKQANCTLISADIPYPIEFDLYERKFYDKIRSISIQEGDARDLIESGGVVLKTVNSEHDRPTSGRNYPYSYGCDAYIG